jgi:hypothetical protein
MVTPLTQEAERHEEEEEEAVNMNLTETEILDRDIEYGEKQNPNGRTYFFYADDSDSRRRRYPKEIQADDLFNNILIHLKSRKKTVSLEDELEFTNIAHIMVERFLQLRQEFSVFNEDQTVMNVLTRGVTDKPLKDYFDNFSTSLHWIMPVITNIKKVYNDVLYEINNENPPQYVNYLDINEDRAFINTLKKTVLSNKMNYENYLREISDILTPFVNRKKTEKTQLKRISTNINTIVNSHEENVDFMSLGGHTGAENSLNIRDDVRFSLLKYNVGLSYLDTINESKKKPDTFFQRKLLHLQADEMQIMSFLVLPECVIRFSLVNLPVSSLLLKSNLSLNYLSYFQLLNRTTKVENNTTSNEIKPKKREIMNYGLIEGDYDGSVAKMVPSTKNLFESMKEYINGKLSVVEVVSYLEPFLVYTRDIHYQLFQEIVTFIENRIALYKGQLSARGAVFGELVTEKEDLIKLCATNLSLMTILNLFSDYTVKITVLNEYDIIDDKDDLNSTDSEIYRKISNSEIYRKMILIDYEKLFCSAISLENSILMVPEEIDDEGDEGEHDLAARVSSSISELQTKLQAEYFYQKEVIEVIKGIESYNYLKYNINKYDMRVKNVEIVEPLEVIKVRDLILQKEDGVIKSFQIRQLVNNFGRKSLPHENKSWYYCNLGDDNIDSVELLPVFVFEMADAFVLRRSPEEYNEFLKNLIGRLKAKKSANNVYYQDPKTGWPIVRIDFVGEKELRFTEEEEEENDENQENERVKEGSRRNTLMEEEEEEEEEKELLDIDEERIVVINQIIDGLMEKLSIAKLPLNVRHFILNNANKYVKSMKTEAEFTKIQANKEEKKRISFNMYIERGTLFSTVAVFFVAFQTSLQSLKYGSVKGCVRSFEGYPLVNEENDSKGLTYISCVLKSMKRSEGIWKHIKDAKENQDNLVYVIKKSLLEEQTIKERIDRKKLQIANGDAIRKETREESLLDKWEHFLPPLEEQVNTEYLKPISKEDLILLQTDLSIGSKKVAADVIQKMESMIFRSSLIIQKQIQDIVSSSENELLMKNYIGQNYISNNCCQAVLSPNSRVFDFFNDESKTIELNNGIAFQLSKEILGAVQFSEASLLCSMFDTRNKFPAINEKFSEKTMNIAFVYYLKYKTGEKLEIPELEELCLQQQRDFTKLSIPEIIEELKKDDVSFKNCFNEENFDKLLRIESKKKIVPSFTSNDCMQNCESIFLKEKEENRDVEDETNLLEMLKNPMNIKARDSILAKNTLNFSKIKNFCNKSSRFFKKSNLELPSPLKSTTTAFSSFYVKVNFFKTMISNMVYLYPEQILRYEKEDKKIELPPGIVKITDSHKIALKNMMLDEINDPIIKAKNKDVKIILMKVKKSTKCRFLEKLSRNLPVNNSPVFNEQEREATEIFYDYIANEILVSYIIFFDEAVKDSTNKETKKQIVTLLQRYIDMCSDFGKKKKKNQLGIELSYQEISDIWFEDAQREKNKILDKLSKMSEDEKDAYNDTKRLKGKQTILNYKEVSQAKAKAKSGDEDDIDDNLGNEDDDNDNGEYADEDEDIFSGGEDGENDGNTND